MTPRTFIFLDIDGVLAHVGSNERLDPACVERLNQLVARARAEVILTSSWRDTFGIAETERRLQTAGFRGILAGAVSCLPQATRSDEIDQFLADCDHPTRFVIVDDVQVAVHLRRCAVIVDDFTGLTDEDVAAAARILEGVGVAQ